MSNLYALHNFLKRDNTTTSNSASIAVLPTKDWEAVVAKEVNDYASSKATKVLSWDNIKLVTTFLELNVAVTIEQDCPIRICVPVVGQPAMELHTKLPLSHIVAVAV